MQYTVCKGGGIHGVLGLIQINTCREVPLQVSFLDDDVFDAFYESYLSTVRHEHFHTFMRCTVMSLPFSGS